MNKIFKIFALIIFSLSHAYVAAEKISVVTSFSILSDLAEQIGGERVSVTSIVGPNQDAHSYALAPSDIKKIQTSKLFIINGLGFEGASFNRIITSTKVNSLTASTGIHTIEADDDHHHDEHETDHHHHGHDHGQTNIDPHAFTNPVLVKTYVKNIAHALIKIDPQGKEYYTQRLNRYLAQLTNLDKWIQQSFNSIPPEKRKVLTGHDAFGYFAKQYGVHFIAPQGVSSDAAPSAKMVGNIIRQARQQKINAIFVENIKDPRIIKQISKETHATVKGKLYSDALSEKSGEAGTYIKMIQYNVTQLSHAMR